VGLGAVGEASPSTPATTPSHPAAPTYAVRTLTDNVLALAATVRDINGGLRGRLALDAEGDGPPALDIEPEALSAPRRGKAK
jgi:hypothetical protein